MQRWLEPPVQSRPSFEEAGLVRYGVLENMAPLGTAPKAAALKKPVQESTPVRRIIFKPSAASAPNSALGGLGKSSDSTAASAKERESSPTTAAVPTKRAGAARDFDEDYTPKSNLARQSSGRASLSRRSLSRPSAARRSSPSPPPQEPEPEPEPEPEQERENERENEQEDLEAADTPAGSLDSKEGTDKVVESAVDEALRHYRYPTAWALRTLYDENSSNPEFLSMLEDVYQQTADADTLEQFSKLMEDKKKEGKKDNKGCYFFIPPTTNSRFTPHKPKPAPYSHLLAENDFSRYSADGDTRLTKRLKISDSRDSEELSPTSPKTPSKRRGRSDSYSSESSLSSVQTLSPPDSMNSAGFRKGGGLATAPAVEPSSRESVAAPGGGQPMSTRSYALATRTNGSQSNSPASPGLTSSHPTTSSTAGSSMPGAGSAPSSPLATSNHTGRGGNKSAKNGAKGQKPEVDPATTDGNDASSRRRSEARKLTTGRTLQTTSSIRGTQPTPETAIVADESSEEPVTAKRGRKTRAAAAAAAAVAAATAAVATPPVTRATRSGKRSHDEIEESSSPTTTTFQEPGVSKNMSRAATPSLPPAKKQRSGPRIKTS
jgi:hypothetical protein